MKRLRQFYKVGLESKALLLARDTVKILILAQLGRWRPSCIVFDQK